MTGYPFIFSERILNFSKSYLQLVILPSGKKLFLLAKLAIWTKFPPSPESLVNLPERDRVNWGNPDYEGDSRRGMLAGNMSERIAEDLVRAIGTGLVGGRLEISAP